MSTFHEVIDVLRKAPSNSERGTLFEKLMVRYFELDPTLSQQYDGVWRWAHWPGNGGRPDNGVDLVARDATSGKYTAIQCKFYEPESYLAKGDLDSVFTESGKRPFTNRIIIVITDRWSSAAEAALENQIMAVQRIGLAEIAESPIRWDIAWPTADVLQDVNLSRRVKRRLLNHQQEAQDAILSEAGLDAETESSEVLHTSLRIWASEVTTAEGNRQVIADLYKKFCKFVFKRQAEAPGIVYMPTEIVDFSNRAAYDISV